jgi:polyhydroxybutyrate depolymerase
MTKPLLLCSLAAALLAACGGDDATATPDAGHADAAPQDPLIQARPYYSEVPPSYDPATPMPLILLVHGYSIDGYTQAVYWRMIEGADRLGFLLAYPDGLTDSLGHKFWNATDGCCNFDDNPVDDVAYLTAVIDDMAKRYNVDEKRVYVVGHSNGGFMAHRLACDRSSKIAAIVSLAGAQWNDVSKCQPSEPVSVLQVHGDADQEILYTGGTANGPYPSAMQTVADWATLDGCTGALGLDGTLDLDTQLAGAETDVQVYAGCPTGIDVQLWTIHGAGHIPNLDASWDDHIWSFLSAHHK